MTAFRFHIHGKFVNNCKNIHSSQFTVYFSEGDDIMNNFIMNKE